MDFQSAMETFAEAWVAANAGAQTQALALTRPKSPKKELSLSPTSSNNDRRESLNRTPTGLQQINSRTTTSTPVDLVSSRSPKNNNNSSSNINNNISNNNNSSNSNLNAIIPINSMNNLNNSNNNSNSGMVTPSNLSPPAHQSNNNSINNINMNNNNNINNNNNNNNPNLPPSCHHSNSTSSLHSFSGANLATKFINNNLANNNNVILENGNNENNINSNCRTSNDAMNEKLFPSPTVERKELDFTKVNSKSLPLHCIVESFTSLQASMINDIRSPWKRRSNIETDSYVIIPSVTPFCDIVKTALQSLGYSIDIANTAKGTIIIKNWKPLALEKITDGPLVSVGEILGELTSVITLRISVIRTKPSSVNDIKDKLLKLLVLQSHSALRSTGCPLDEILLSQICRNNTFPFEVSDDLRRKFDQWWSNQITPQANPIATKILPPFVNPNAANVTNELEFAARHLHGVGSREQLENHHHQPHHNMIVHPALQTVHSQYPSQKTRMRTSFDPEMELPKLQKWFQENPHPSRQQIQSYVIQLNSLESRRGRKPLDVNNVVYWFKNARAAQKRAELRGHGLGNGYGPSAGLLMSHSDYMKSPHSIPSEDIDNLSQHSDDMDDDMDRPVSPQGPLSLTTHERNRSPINIDDVVKIENDRSNSSPPIMSAGGGNQEMTQTIKNERNESELMNHSGELRAQNNDSPKTSPTSEELDMDDSGMTPNDFRSPSPDSRRELSFPIVPNSVFSHSIMYMSHYMPAAMGHGHHATPNSSPNALGPVGLNLSNLSNDERRKRNRTFIDPVTEVPKLEQWFAMNTHPSHNLILKYTEDLNRMPYRQKFPRLESKNVQFWFKNRRAKCKRLKMSLYDTSQLSALSSFHPGDREIN